MTSLSEIIIISGLAIVGYYHFNKYFGRYFTRFPFEYPLSLILNKKERRYTKEEIKRLVDDPRDIQVDWDFIK